MKIRSYGNEGRHQTIFYLQGRPATRLTDKMLLNKGNTISAGGYFTGPVNDPDNEELLEEICKAACLCKAQNTLSQRCVDDEIKRWAVKAGRNIIGGAAYNKIVDALTGDSKWTLSTKDGNASNTSAGNVLRGGQRMPDFSDFDNQSMVEVKLPKDRFRGKQYDDYADAADDNEMTREDVYFKDCDCEGKGRSQKEQAADAKTAKAEQKSSSLSTSSRVGIGLGVAGGIGAIACVLLEPCGAIVVGGAAAAGELLLPAAGAALAVP